MKYGNVELTELQPSDWDNKPRLMLVWNNYDYKPKALKVMGYIAIQGRIHWIANLDNNIGNDYECNAYYDGSIKLQNTYHCCAELPSSEQQLKETINKLKEDITRLSNRINERETELRREFERETKSMTSELTRLKTTLNTKFPDYMIKSVMDIILPDDMIKELLSKSYGKYKEDFIWEWTKPVVPEPTYYNTHGKAIKFIHVITNYYDDYNKSEYWLTPDPTMQMYKEKYSWNPSANYHKIYCSENV